jgi:putative peptide zinc metalloprotease protein
MSSSFFTDSWHKISGLHVSLAPAVVVQSQKLRGKLWFILKDPFNENFFKVTKESFQFIQCLTTDKTIQQVWETYVEKHPELAPSREEVTLIITQLHGSNLLYFENDPDNHEIFNHIKSQNRKAIYSKITSVLYFKIPLWNPNSFLTWVNKWTAKVPATPLVLLWAAVLFFGGWQILTNLGNIYDKAQGIISLNNLPWLYLCMALMKLIHEFAHGLVCKRFGGSVKKFGVMFLIFTPLPYVDVTSIWSFTNRWHRIWVGVAGMAIELFMASIAAIIWSKTGPGLLNSVCFNVMFIGSVSSLLFNGNPLLRFDAYYVLSDYLEIPNLYQKAQTQCLYIGEKYLLRSKNIISTAHDEKESTILVSYGVASFIYLLIVSFGIASFLLDKWLPLGLVSFTALIVMKFLLPYFKLVKFVKNSATLAHRGWAYLLVIGLPSLLILIFLFVPVPNNIKAPGAIEAENSPIYYNPTDGRLTQLVAQNGEYVKAGQILMVLENPDLLMDKAIKQSEIDEAVVRHRSALFQAPDEIASSEKNLAGLQEESNEIDRKLALLTVKASHDGIWVAPDIAEFKGDWIRRGKVLGQLINNAHLRFSAVITQEQANELFKISSNMTGELRIEGQTEKTVKIDSLKIVPYRSDILSSPALGWAGGGDIPTNINDKDGTQTKEPFFYIRGNLPADLPKNMTALHGLSGLLRIPLQPVSLSNQLSRFFRQLIQKRYGFQ